MNIIPWNGEKITEPGIYSNLALEKYHGDICDGPSVSSSGLRTIIAKSPNHYFYNSYHNPNPPEEIQKKHFNIGKAAHTLLLSESGFSQEYAIRPDEFKTWYTKAAKEWREDAVKAGKVVLIPQDIEIIKGISERLSQHPYAPSLLRGGIELSMFWKDAETGIWLKSRPDSIPTESDMFADLKIVQDASGRKVRNSVIDHGYYMQLALAGQGMARLLGRKPTNYVLVFCEKEPPYSVNIKELDTAFVDLGDLQIRRALKKLSTCLESNEWPDYPDDGSVLYPPEFLKNQIHEQIEYEEQV